MEVSSHVSPIAALGFVREALVKQQQEMGKAKGIVMDLSLIHIYSLKKNAVIPYSRENILIIIPGSATTLF